MLTPLHHLSDARVHKFFLPITQFKDFLVKIYTIFLSVVNFLNSLFIYCIISLTDCQSKNFLFFSSIVSSCSYTIITLNMLKRDTECSVDVVYILDTKFVFLLDQISFYTHRHMYISCIQGWFILIYYHT